MKQKKMIILLKGNETVLSEERVASILDKLVSMGVAHNDIPSVSAYIRPIEPETEYEKYKDECQWYKMLNERDRDLLLNFGEDDFRVFKRTCRSHSHYGAVGDSSLISSVKDCYNGIKPTTEGLKTVPIPVQLKNLQPPESLVAMMNAQRENRKERETRKHELNRLKKEVENSMFTGGLMSRSTIVKRDGKWGTLSPIQFKGSGTTSTNYSKMNRKPKNLPINEIKEVPSRNSSPCNDHVGKILISNKPIQVPNTTINLEVASTSLLNGTLASDYMTPLAEQTITVDSSSKMSYGNTTTDLNVSQNKKEEIVSNVHNRKRRKHHLLTCIYHPNSIDMEARKLALKTRFPQGVIRKSLARKLRAKRGLKLSSHTDSSNDRSSDLNLKSNTTDDPRLCFVLPGVISESPKELHIPLPKPRHITLQLIDGIDSETNTDTKYNNLSMSGDDSVREEKMEISEIINSNDPRNENSFDENILENRKIHISRHDCPLQELQPHSVGNSPISVPMNHSETSHTNNFLLSGSEGINGKQLKNEEIAPKISLCDLIRCTTLRMHPASLATKKGKEVNNNIVLLSDENDLFPKGTKGNRSPEETEIVPPTQESGTPSIYPNTSSPLDISYSRMYTPDLTPFGKPTPAYYRTGSFYDCDCSDRSTSDDGTDDPNTNTENVHRTSDNMKRKKFHEKRSKKRSSEEHGSECVEAVSSDCYYSNNSDSNSSTGTVTSENHKEDEGDMGTLNSAPHSTLKGLTDGFRAVKVQAARKLESKLTDREEQRSFACQERTHLHLVASQAEKTGHEYTLCRLSRTSTPTNASMWAPMFDAIHGDRQYMVNVQNRYADFIDYCTSVKFPSTQTEQNFIADLRDLCMADTAQRPGSQALKSATANMSVLNDLRTVTLSKGNRALSPVLYTTKGGHMSTRTCEESVSIDGSNDKSLFNIKNKAMGSNNLLYAKGTYRLRGVIKAKSKEPEVFQRKVAVSLLLIHGGVLMKSRNGTLVADKFRQICGINTKDFIDLISCHEHQWGPYSYDVKQLIKNLMFSTNSSPSTLGALPPLSRVVQPNKL
eukprot:Tbor_TRINITY_DN2706_c0_g1::TRINITY_DN2706_c0_g1_i1::g.15203::m.15203